MLRNLHRCNQQLVYLEFKGCAHISTVCAGTSYAKSDSIRFQSKVMSKLVGQRVTGSKKRWYPSNEGSTSNLGKNRNAEVFSNAHITKPNTSGSKNTTRRMAVLNKLFMQHITDLLATGEASEAILGRGLQVTRVKISPDFSGINVYWLGKGDAVADGLLETELHRCSGRLRHELSQLMLMSEVPRIKFAREKKFSSVAQVEALLSTIDFATTEETSQADLEEIKHDKYNFFANMTQREFYGKNTLDAAAGNLGDDEEHFPEMRHDVFGLDHRRIMSKLKSKMRKSQQAWEQHSQKVSQSVNQLPPAEGSLEEIQQKIAEAAEKSEKFAKFLAKRREYRNTPQRKKHDRASEWRDVHAEQATLEASARATLTPIQQSLLEAEDYLYEEYDKGENNK